LLRLFFGWEGSKYLGIIKNPEPKSVPPAVKILGFYI
jgi:hypothetical protein